MSVRRIWVTSHDFQAPGMYEKEGFKRMAELKDGPRATSMWFSAKHYQAGKTKIANKEPMPESAYLPWHRLTS